MTNITFDTDDFEISILQKTGARKSTRDDMIRLNVPLDPLFHARLKARAAMHYMTLEQVVKEALGRWMKDNPEPTY